MALDDLTLDLLLDVLVNHLISRKRDVDLVGARVHRLLFLFGNLTVVAVQFFVRVGVEARLRVGRGRIRLLFVGVAPADPLLCATLVATLLLFTLSRIHVGVRLTLDDLRVRSTAHAWWHKGVVPVQLVDSSLDGLGLQERLLQTVVEVPLVADLVPVHDAELKHALALVGEFLHGLNDRRLAAFLLHPPLELGVPLRRDEQRLAEGVVHLGGLSDHQIELQVLNLVCINLVDKFLERRLQSLTECDRIVALDELVAV